jgi:DNA-directed RNA polymerase specialized sigma24 family protein
MKKRLEPMASDLEKETDARLKDLLPRLERIIKRELTYLQSQGDLPPDYPTVQDVLDEVITKVKCDWKQDTDSQTTFIELLRAMHKVLDDEVRNSRMFGEAVSLEAMPPEDATDQAEEMVGEEINEFWQPDELLRYEDVIPDDESILPEEAVQEDEQEINYLFVLLKDLPIHWRRALLMKELENISLDDLGMLFESNRSEILSWIESANHYLRARLKDAGFSVETESLFTLKTGK